MKIKVAQAGAKCHPTKVAVFSADDIFLAEDSIYNLMTMRPAVDINGVVMRMWVSPIVPKGSIYVVNGGTDYFHGLDEVKK